MFYCLMAIAPGTRFGRYEIRSLLGAGGMGEVYLAQDTQLRRPVAIKLLSADFTINKDRLRRFELEAYAASSLNHPNILTIYEVGAENGLHFIATEYIDGDSLRQHISSASPELREVLDIGIQVASALAAAHAAGIVHRDIKPENVMIRRDRLVKVLDFGLAKLIEEEPLVLDTEAPTKALAETAPGAIMGTIAYMSPEQARGIEVDPRTDIWSLGVMLYEMVAGRLPFEGQTTSDVIGLILHKEPPPLARFAPDTPTELERIVTKAVCKDKEERYQVVKDMGLDLKSLKQRLEFEAELERTGTPERSSEARGTATSTGDSNAEMTHRAAVQIDAAGFINVPLSVESMVGKIKRHKLGAALLVAALMLAITSLFYYRNREVAKAEVNALAVLPFTNAPGDVNTEYLADGISESLINSLSQLPRLKVIARSSVFTYKGKEIDIQQVANALGVQAIVTGRVVQRGDNLQISVEMVDASDKTLMWGNQYNRKAVDLQAVQEEIAREISERLRFRLTGEEQKRVTKHYTDNPEAYQLYLEGRFYWGKRTDEGLKKSIDYFNRAIEVDPNYALAYTGLANSYSVLGLLYLLSPKEAYARARVVAGRALEIDDQLAEARLSLAIIKFFYDWNWGEGEKECQEAIRLNPNLAQAHYVYAQYLASAGRFDDAIREAQRSQELDPLAGDINTTAGWIYYFARRTDEAMKEYNRVIEIDPNFFRAHRLLGLCYLQKNRPEEAIAEMQKSVALSKNSPEEIAYLGYAYAVTGRRDEARKVIEKLNALAKEKYVSPYLMALIYTGLDERDQAIGWLEKSYEARSSNMMFLKVDPKFDNIRPDPRFQDLMRRVRLTP